MTAGMRTIMYPVADLDAAKNLYGALFGVEPYMAKVQEITDVGGGKPIATAQDSDGNIIGLLQLPHA